MRTCLAGTQVQAAKGEVGPRQNPDKYQVCTITLNSTDEREIFQKRLSPKDFDFIELTELKDGEDSDAHWFTRACQLGIQCDLLVVSGHFAGEFMGDGTSLRLPLELLERHSCGEDCEGILKRPREIFLFGCNTLAEKDKDHRTPERYRRDLIQHGVVSPAIADRVVEARYGAMGDSFKERMRRTFMGVPSLYGFSSSAPFGKDIRRHLEKYFESKPAYGQHLEKGSILDLSSALSTMNRNQGYPFNAELKQALKPFSFTQCSGLIPGDPKEEGRVIHCQLLDRDLSLDAKLELISNVMKRKDFLSFFDGIEAFFRENPPKNYTQARRELFDRIKQNETAKKTLLEVIRSLPPGKLSLDVLAMASLMNWVSREVAEDVIARVAKKAFHAKPAQEDIEELLIGVTAIRANFDGKLQPKLSLKDLPSGWERKEALLGVLSAFRVKVADPVYERRLAEELASGRGGEAVGSALAATGVESPEVLQKLLEISIGSQFGTVREASLSAIQGSRLLNSAQVADFYSSALGNRHQAAAALRALRNLELKDPKISKSLGQLLNSPDPDIQVKAVRALKSYPFEDEQIWNRVIELSKAEDPSLRNAVLYLLPAGAGRFPVEKVLIEALETDSSDAANAMTFLPGLSPEAEVALAKFVARTGLASETLRTRGVKNPESQLELLGCVEKGAVFIAKSCAQALGTTQPEDSRVIQALERSIKNGFPANRKLAVELAGGARVQDPRIIRALEKLIADSSEPSLGEPARIALRLIHEKLDEERDRPRSARD